MQNTALITGASTGIGATYADRLARRGHDLILVARDRSRLEALAERLRHATGRIVEVLPADLTNPGDLRLVEERLRDDAAITMLVNNAGRAVAGSVLGSDVDEQAAMVALNVTAALRLVHAAANAFVQRGKGTVINVASVLALAPERFNATYSATKAFVLNLSLGLQAELAGTGVRVQAVLPGATRTEIWDRAGIDLGTLPAEIVMEVGDLVDAALRGLELGEAVTIPPLPDVGAWERLQDARLAMAPNLSRSQPAARYLTA